MHTNTRNVLLHMIALYLRIESIRNIHDSTIQLKLVKETKFNLVYKHFNSITIHNIEYVM